MTFNILDYGARVSDALQTEAIQKTIDACFLAGGGEVRVPAGIYRVGGLRLRSNVTLYLESGAVLEGSRNPEDYTGYINDQVEPIITVDDPSISRSVYPYSRWMNALIRVHNAKNVAIVGEKGSFIDGMNCFDELGEEGYRGPHGICIHDSDGVRLEGYTMKNSSNWAHAIFKTQNIEMRNVTVYGGHDGFDIRVCDNVLVEDCKFATGDDCIAGFDNNDVIIRRCMLDSSCSALRFGGHHVLVEECEGVAPTSFGFRGNLTVEQKKANVLADETCRHNMGNVFLYYCDFRADPRKTPGDILIRNCKFKNADRLLALAFDGKHKWCCNRPLTSIKYQDCVFEGINQPTYIYGDANEPITVELENVKLTVREGAEDIPLMEARNYKAISLKNVTVEGYKEPRICIHTEGKISMSDSGEIPVVPAEENGPREGEVW